MGAGLESRFASIVDEIYEAAFIPEKWLRVLDLISATADCAGSTMFLAARAKTHFIASDRLLRTYEDCVKAGVMELSQNPRASRMLAKNHPGFITDTDVLSLEEIESHPMYRLGLRPTGFGWGTGTFVPLVNGDMLVFSCEKRFDRGPVTPDGVSALDELRPHLARSAAISARVSFERMRAAIASLAEIGLPAFAVDGACRQLAENNLVDELRQYISHGAFNTVQFRDRKADRLFRNAIRSIDRDGPGTSRSFIAYRPEDDLPPAVIHILPIRKNAHDIFGRAEAVVVANLPNPVRHPNADILNNIFDLTPAQSRVARSLLSGKTLQETARDLKLSRETVKSHLDAVFVKTGTHRQSDLVILLSSLLIRSG